MSITVLLPAHNEAEQIADTIESLLAQTRPPERIVVIADNCTDATVAIASTYPVTVMETVDNPHRKAGALNQGWAAYAQDADLVFTMDADTVLAPDFFALADQAMASGEIGGACACPMLKPTPEDATAWGALLWRMGRLDFGGYMRILCRWKMQPEVLFGYGTILSGAALHAVAAERGGAPWDTDSIVEDYRLSLDLRRLGYRLAIIPGALAYTDAPVTIWGPQGLWRQRMRWAGGTWQELAREGWHPRTRKVWVTAVGCAASAVVRLFALTLWVTALALHLPIAWSWWWVVPLAVAFIDRVDTTRYTKGSDWKDVLLVGSFLPIEAMSVLREAWTLRSAWVVSRRRRLSW